MKLNLSHPWWFIQSIRDIMFFMAITLVIALLSIGVMDVIIFPLATLAVADSSQFTRWFIVFLAILLVALPALAFARSLYLMKRNQLGFIQVLKKLLFIPVQFIISLTGIVSAILVLTVLTIMMMNLNSNLLERIANG